MLEIILYTIIFIIGFIFPLLFSIYCLYCIIGDLKGAPFVPTTDLMVDEILKQAKLQKGQMFIELGSGDGRVVRKACQKYKVQGLGIDIHRLLNWYATILSKFQNINDISFITKDLYKQDLQSADVVFLFLLPKTLVKLRGKLQYECRKGTLVISHGFKIEGLESKLIDRIERKMFPTYYYRM